MKKSLRYVVLGLAAATVLACGGGGAGIGGGGGTEIPVAQRSAAIASVEQKGMELAAGGLTLDQQNVQLADFMRTKDEFAEVKVTAEQNVFGRFTDGRLYLYVNNRQPDFATGAIVPPLNLDRRQTQANPVVATSRQARLFHSFGLGFNQQQHPINEMGNYLRAAGYTLRNPAEGDARLATLRGVSGDGFFYFNTHGGGLELSASEKTYGAGTSTLRTADNDSLPEIKNDLDNLRILYMTAPNGESTTVLGITIPRVDTRYAITHRFVERYMSFGPNAVIFMNACWSGKTDVSDGAQAFMFAFFKKGAGAYLGWTDKVSTPISEQAPLYFVDRLTAANMTDPEDPVQRPFFVDEIVANMKSKNLANSGLAELIVKNRVANTTIGLRPTIESLTMFEQINKFIIFGQFGPIPGQVFVGGKEVTNVQWAPNQIVCEIPRFGEGSYGEVVVKVFDKESNKRMLTLWSGPFTYNETSGNLVKTGTGMINFRADFADIRKRPGQVPKRVDPVPIALTTDSSLTWQARGQETDSEGKVIVRWRGGGTPDYTFDAIQGTSPTGTWNCAGAYDPVKKRLALALVNGGDWEVFANDETNHLIAFAAGMLKGVDTTTWIIEKFDSGSGSPRWVFGPFLPSSPPTDEMLLGD